MKENKLHTIDQASHILKCGRTKLYGLINKNEIITVKIGGRRFILDDDINKYIREKRLPYYIT